MSIAAYAQTETVTVTVFDSTGPLPGANVMIKGTTTGAMSDLDGVVKIDGVKANDVLVVSFIGFSSVEFTPGTKTSHQITLKEDTNLLEETIVVGYGVQKKESLTGAISQIRTEDITNTKSVDALTSLQGKVPGLLIRDTGGKPGAFGTELSLRGYGTPMIVVDGVVRNTTMTRKTTGWTNSAKNVESYNDMSVLQEINPEDIESVSVLKDASAAIYGLGAANGVILITTKKGKSMKPSVSFSASVRLQQPVTNRNVEDWVSFMKWDNAMADVAKLPHRYTEEKIAGFEKGEEGYNYTDWYNVAAKKVTVNQNYNLSIRGGNDKISYYLGLGFADDDSILKSKSYTYKRYNINGSVTAEIIKNLTATYTTSMRISNQTTPGNPDVDWNLQYYIYATDPETGVHPINNPNHWSEVNEHMNVGALLDPASSGISKNLSRSFNNTIDLKYDAPFLKGLSFQATGAYDYNASKSQSLTLQYDTYDYKTDTYAATLRVENEYSELWTDNQRLYGRIQANFNRQFGKHNVGATLAAELTRNKRAQIQGSRLYGPSSDDSFFTHPTLNSGLGTTAENAGTRSDVGSAGYIGRITYNYSGKYLVEVMGRYDGTYVYQKGKRFGFFPSYSLGWRISEEKFIKENTNIVNNLKIRWSDGFTGSIQGGAYAYINGYSQAGSWIFKEGATSTGFANTSIANTVLTWANVRMMDVGIDWDLWNGKLGGSFDWFNRSMKGIAAASTVSLPDFYGVSLPQQNLNSNENIGLELSLSSNGQIGEFNYRVGASATYTRSRMTHIESEKDRKYKSSMDYWKNATVGRWDGARSQSRYEWAGGQITSLDYASNLGILYSTQGDGKGNNDLVPGMYRIDDRDGDGYITSNDQYYVWRDANPPLQFGLNFSGSWKNLDFSMVFSGASLKTKNLGLSSYAGFGYLYQLPKMYTKDCYSVKEYGADPWDPNTEWNTGYWPALCRVSQSGQSHNVTYTSNQPYNQIDATYLRLKSLEIGYRISPKFLQKAGIKSFRVFFNGGNLFTLCNKDLQFVDPESTDNGRAGGSFQINRTYNFGLTLNF